MTDNNKTNTKQKFIIKNTNTEPKIDYQKKTCAELISLCKEKKIKGYSGKNKNEIINLLTKNQPII